MTIASPALAPSGLGEAVKQVRTELFEAFIAALNASGIAYCVLCGYRGYPEVIESDVDFVVAPVDLPRFGPLLEEVAERCDALLVQSIQHETGAYYFVLAKQVGCEVAYLHPDCSGDYRRDGRMWLAATPVLANRRRYKTFFVPAMADEFQYYLIKKVLKQWVGGAELQRLAGQYFAQPEECCLRIRRFWSATTAGTLASALVRQDLAWMQQHMPELLDELRTSAPLEGWPHRIAQCFGECHRWMKRLVHPTGMCIAIYSGTARQRRELALALERSLQPAFRRTRILAENETQGLRRALSTWLAKVSSTLVIRMDRCVQPGWFARNQICFETTGDVQYDKECVRQGALSWMAERLQRRMRRGRTETRIENFLTSLGGLRLRSLRSLR